MRSADIIILGGGIIGLSLAFELAKSRAKILVLERREPGLEASHAAAGMLAPSGDDLPAELQALADASAAIYPEFVREIEEASGLKVDLRTHGTILLPATHDADGSPAGTRPLSGRYLSAEDQQKLEPKLLPQRRAVFLAERSVDPRSLTAACLAAAKARGVQVASGEEVREARPRKDAAGNKILEVATAKASYSAPVVVNCCGAWSGQVAPFKLPTKPIKGQMLSLIAARETLSHVIRGEEVYVVPRSDGRILIGSTVEDVGFDKRVDPGTIQRLRAAAEKLAPALAAAKLHEAWAGLRPGSADGLPLMGAMTSSTESGPSSAQKELQLPGCYVATGHFRNGILLAAITARLMAQVILNQSPQIPLDAFSPQRFLR